MKRPLTIFLALLAPFALAWSTSSDATGNCQNGKTLYNKTNASVATACSNSACHGSNPANNVHGIWSAGAGNPGAIDAALDYGVTMQPLQLKVNLPLNASDIDDLATWIFFAPTCPAVAPNVFANPTSAPFGSVNVGSTSATQVITVSNTGAGNATGLSYANTNAAEFLVTKTCGASLAAGATCTITLSYRPSAPGADAATYTITGAGGVNVPIALSGTGVAVGVATLQASPPLLSFGNVTVGQTSAAIAVTISNSGGAAASGIALNNSNATEFVVVGNTCGATLNAGASCAINVAYAPSAAGADSATLTINYGSGAALSISLSGAGVSGPPPSGQLSLPPAVTMSSQNVGTASAPRAVAMSNVGGAAVTVTAITSSNAAEFPLSGSTCTTVNAGASCTFNITFLPSAAGVRSSTIAVASSGIGSPQTIVVSGTGSIVAGPPTATAVEYYHQGFDHYFMTAIADEITKLDNGTFVGWARTGQSLKIYPSAAAGLNAVCRFFSTSFAPKSSHFYTPLPPECTVVKTNPNWMFEAEVFFVAVPALDGSCPAGTNPVYRVYNNGQGGAPNHRYTTDLTVRSTMLAFGWIPEGYGSIGVIMCVPP